MDSNADMEADTQLFEQYLDSLRQKFSLEVRERIELENEPGILSGLKGQVASLTDENKQLKEQLALSRQSEQKYRAHAVGVNSKCNSLAMEKSQTEMQLISCQSQLFNVLTQKETLAIDNSERTSVIEITHMLRMLLATQSITPAQAARQLMFLNTDKFVKNISCERLNAFTDEVIETEGNSGDTVIDSQATEIDNLKKAVEFYKKNSVSSFQLQKAFKHIIRLVDGAETSTSPLGTPSNSAKASSSGTADGTKFVEHLTATISDLDTVIAKAKTTWTTYGDNDNATRILLQRLPKMLEKAKAKQQAALESFLAKHSSG